jgi:hypothetical protein
MRLRSKLNKIERQAWSQLWKELDTELSRPEERLAFWDSYTAKLRELGLAPPLAASSLSELVEEEPDEAINYLSSIQGYQLQLEETPEILDSYYEALAWMIEARREGWK